MAILGTDPWTGSVPELGRTLAVAEATLARFRHCIPRPVRDELVQEAALRAWTARGVRHPAAYARRIAQNLAVDWLRRPVELPLSPVEVPTTGDWARIEATIDAQRAWELLSRSPAYQALLRAVYVDETDVDTLVSAAAGRERCADWCRARDAIYKRHRRALAWTRRALGG